MKVFIIAGEPSGDKLGGALMRGLKTILGDSSVELQGIGGVNMVDQGLTSRFAMSELSIMGIAEVLPKYWHLKRRISETADAVIAANPDVLITIDSPDFCLRVAKLVKRKSRIRTVHYVAPTVWAWRAGRAVKMARVIDHVLALFPFEPPFMQAAGMDCDFVGHPVVSEPIATEDEMAGFRDKYTLGSSPILLVLPGSRRGEVMRLAPVFGQGLAPVLQRFPDLKVVIPTTHTTANILPDLVRDWKLPVTILDPNNMKNEDYLIEKRAIFKLSTAALAASGTVSLELAAAKTPMVIAYDMNWISRQIISRMLKVDTVTLVNLVSDTRVVPEFIGVNCKPDKISEAVISILDDPEKQIDAMELTMDRLGLNGEDPGLRAAKAIVARL
ncbi:MAG: lipid-A-disaccharide synthase [Rhodobacterales bacterium]|nr:lipid-A-disaccharide synthase [Rhodobacterales bacterium]